MVQLVNQIAREIATEHHGHVPDVFMIDARVRAYLEKNPDAIDLDKMALHMRRMWDRLQHDAVNRSPTVFVPGAFITLPKRERVQMKSMLVTDLAAWHALEAQARENFLASMDRKAAYRNQRLTEFSASPDCRVLGDIEARFHGCVASEHDDDVPLDEEDAE
jgi:hypothetical protein